MRVTKDIQKFTDDYGESAFHKALFQGQSKHANGIGFCRTEPAWSNTTIREICRRHGRQKKEVAILDIHTGLGPYGRGTILVKNPVAPASSSSVPDWFDDDYICVRSDPSMPFVPVGDMMSALKNEFDVQTNVVSAALEFGTFSTDEFMRLQIDDARLRPFGNEASEHGKVIKQQLQTFFCPANDAWRRCILARSKQVVGAITKAFVGDTPIDKRRSTLESG